MKGLSIILTATFLLLASSCSNITNYEDLGLEYDVKQIIFFSDEANYNNEAPYYDAIIELKRDFPEDFENMMVLTGDKADKYNKLFDVENHPALIVYYKDEVVVNINGTVSKDEIIKPLANVLSNDLATSH